MTTRSTLSRLGRPLALAALALTGPSALLGNLSANALPQLGSSGVAVPAVAGSEAGVSVADGSWLFALAADGKPTTFVWLALLFLVTLRMFARTK